MKDYIKYAQDKNYSDFKDVIRDKVKSLLRNQDRVIAHTETIDNYTQKIKKLKEI